MPGWLRDSVRLRALAVGSGLIPPRKMHSDAEAALIARLAAGRRWVVEIGVYEGSSAAVVAAALGPKAVLHLIDPFGGNALRPGQRGTAAATRRVVARAAGRDAPELRWHVMESHAAAQGWTDPVDLVFIDGDHTEEGCRLDWDDWHGFVEPGGVVLFHDARLGRPDGYGLAGPSAVVDRLFRSASPLPDWRITAELDSAVAVERVV